MENLRNNPNKMHDYPDKKVMELFLVIGDKTKLFDTESRKTTDGNDQLIYKNAHAITTLSIIVDYLSMPGNENRKESFLEELENAVKTSKIDEFYKRMGGFALDILEAGNPEPQIKKIIEINRKKLNESESNIFCFPVLTTKVAPERYAESKSDRLIHREFIEEVKRLKGITDDADKIAAQYNGHKFTRGGTDYNEIEELIGKL